jgi:hypothetical protein
MKAILTFLFLYIVCFSAFSQKTSGSLVIHFDRGVESAIQGYIAQVTEEKPKGFRVQLCSESGNNAKTIANGIKSQFLSKYRDVPAYLIWESPNFKVRVGDFKTRLDATLFWKQIQDQFPQSYVVMDQINLFRAE